CRDQVAHLARPQLQDRGVVGVTLGAAVPGAVVVAAVAAVLAIGLVVLLVVAHEVVEGETVVAGDEVDARRGPPALALVEVGGPAEAVREVAHAARLAPPAVADSVAETAFALRPADRA